MNFALIFNSKNYWFALWWCALRLWNSSLFVSMLFRDCFTVSTPVHMEKAPQMWNGDSTAVVKQKSSHRLFHSMTVSQYDHVVPYTDLGDRGYFGVNAALVNCLVDSTDNAFLPEASFGLRVLSSPLSVYLSVCVCVCVCVYQSLACPHDNSSAVQAKITKFET